MSDDHLQETLGFEVSDSQLEADAREGGESPDAAELRTAETMAGASEPEPTSDPVEPGAEFRTAETMAGAPEPEPGFRTAETMAGAPESEPEIRTVETLPPDAEIRTVETLPPDAEIRTVETLPPDAEIRTVETLPPDAEIRTVETLPPGAEPGPVAAKPGGAPATDGAADRGVTETLPASSRASGSRSSRKRRAPGKARSGIDRLPRVGEQIYHYELIRELGRGGMGVVFLARDTKLARRVAIKFITSDNPALTKRFIVEARATARCHHENIVIIHDIDEYEGNPFMVLEFLQGRALSDVIGADPMSWERAVEIMIPVVRALERAHGSGIVHRDLKPDNIFVTDSGVVKVLDFGIVKLVSEPGSSDADALSRAAIQLPDNPERHHKTVGLVGTLPYMSPEQLKSGEIDARTDLWAVGIILLEMMLGAHPLAPLNTRKLQTVSDLDRPMPPSAERLASAGPGARAAMNPGFTAMLDRCLIKRKADRVGSASELLAELESLTTRRGRPVLGEDESPFTGLAAFQKSDADRFFGRDKEIATVVARLQSQPLVTLVGPSGSGKSSLVRAGVIPALERSGEGWQSLVLRPGRRPIDALVNLLDDLAMQGSTVHPGRSTGSHSSPEAGLETSGSGTRDELAQRLRDEPGYLGQELRAWSRRKLRKVIVLVDQFEELYTLEADPAERIAFVRCLEGAADDASSPVRVVLSIRSDFLDRVVEDNHFMAEVTRGLVLLPPIGRDGLRDALTRPVEATGYRFEGEHLVDTMLDALEATSGALPLLQFAATKLWETRDRDNKVLTRASYDDFGGVAGALAAHADAVVSGMPAARVRLVRGVMQRLVTPERTRAIATLRELRELPGDPDTIEQVIHHLSDARLLAIETGPGGGDAGGAGAGDDATGGGANGTVEIIHESLIAGWPMLKRWLDDDKDDAAFLARLRAAAQQWHDSGRSEGMLWRGDPAREAQTWRDRHRGELPGREKEYMAAVLALASRAARIKRLALGGTVSFLVLLLVAATVALVMIRDANRMANNRADELDEKSRQLSDSLSSEKAQKEAAERATREAEDARKDALAAQAQAEADAERARQALAEAQEARQEAQTSAQQALAARTRAEAERQNAEAQRKNAETEKERAQKAQAKADAERSKAEREAEAKQRLIDRAVGPVKRSIR